MVYRVPLLRVNTDILANIFAVIANLEKKESGGCNVAVDNATVLLKSRSNELFGHFDFRAFATIWLLQDVICDVSKRFDV